MCSLSSSHSCRPRRKVAVLAEAAKKANDKKRMKVSSPKKPARKTRTKTRKPKYLSLKLELSSNSENKSQNPQKPTNKMPHKQQQQQQLNLFPLHPEILVQDRDMHDDHVADHVAFLFETATDTSTTLQDLNLIDTSTATTTTTTTEDQDPLSPSSVLTFVNRGNHQEGLGGASSLVKTAMRCKERDPSEERWVSYWEVVEKREQEEVEVSSCGGEDAWRMMMMQVNGGDKKGLVGLKLDYQKIMNAWSDKGSLYVDGEAPQTVPDLHDGSNALMDGWGSVGNLWSVPEMGGMTTMEKLGAAKDGSKLRRREESVMRYKEKRQSRLFSKRIRYEVRKLNADNRPRLKGRFVKRSGEEE